jgi:arsenate reductase-like glutaredoxin family protein
MRPSRPLHLGWWCRLVGIGCLSLLAAFVLAGDSKKGRAKEPAEKQEAKRASKEADKMVEAIVNRNKEPKVVRRRHICPSEFPLFPKDYDWKEEERVRTALRKLYNDTSVEVWEAMVRKGNDRRYCNTSYSGSSADVYIDSVGEICSKFAYKRLCGVFARHLPSLPPHGCPIQFRDVRKNMTAWRDKRKDKSLFQLQIEMCEMALRELAKLDANDFSDKEKAEVRKKIEADIKDLRKTKRPIVEKPSVYNPGYPSKEAERVRAAYEKGTLEKFRSGLNK